MMTGVKKYVIIPAGGVGSRMGAGIPKQMLELSGVPILRRTVELFLNLPFEVHIVISINPTLKEAWKQYCRENGFMFRHTLVPGGMTRFHSVQKALKYIPEDAVVAVHDAVRPLLRSSEIISLFEEAEKYPAVIPVLDAVDSMRQFASDVDGVGNEGFLKGSEIARDGSIQSVLSKIVPRSEYRLVQTPQIFHSGVLKEAYTQPYMMEFTDDASVVERLGVPLHFVSGSRLNIKITTAEDMVLAEAILNHLL